MVYPSGTDRQLLRLLHWRSRTTRPELIRLALWVECFPVDLGVVRDDLTALVDMAAAAVQRELRDDDGHLLTTLDGIARTLTAGRETVPTPPRAAGTSREERERAIGDALSAAVGDFAVTSREDDRLLLEHLLGLRRGRGWHETALIPLPGNGVLVSVLPTVWQARSAIRDALPEELTAARHVVRGSIEWLPIILPRLLRDAPFGLQTLLERAQRSVAELGPITCGLVAVALIVTIRAQGQPIAKLRENVQALACSGP